MSSPLRMPALWHLRLALVLGAFGTALACLMLWGHWTSNPELAHGMILPAAFAYLVLESRKYPAAPGHSPFWLRLLPATATPLFVLLAGLYAAAFGWSHPLPGLFGAAAISSLCLLFLCHGLGWPARNWQGLCAALLWLTAAPMPPGSYSRLAAGLQHFVSATVLHILNLLGIPATRQGTIIELATTRVGVEEACSGVRSLIACCFAALLISALLLRRPAQRLLLLGLTPLLALLMNLLRSLGLTLAANSGLNIEGPLHDISGYAILVLTALLLLGLALVLERRTPAATPVAPNQPPDRPLTGWTLLAPTLALGLLCSGLLIPSVLAQLVTPKAAAHLNQLMPNQVPGWQQEDAVGLERFAGILKTERLLERNFYTQTEVGLQRITLYLAAWEAGESSPAEVALHTPEACWPGAGWRRLENTDEAPLPGFGRALSFHGPGAEAVHVIYWHFDGDQSLKPVDSYTPAAVLATALKQGFRAPQPQLFVRVSGNIPPEKLLTAEPIQILLSRLGIYGLSNVK